MKIIELKTVAEFAAAYPLIKQQNPKITRKAYVALLAAMRPKGFRCVAAMDGEKMVGICGFWLGVRFWCGEYIDLDNLIVDKDCRSQGVGRKLVQWIEKEGKKHGCTMVGLDSYVVAKDSHRFYFREKYHILGYHFVKYLK